MLKSGEAPSQPPGTSPALAAFVGGVAVVWSVFLQVKPTARKRTSVTCRVCLDCFPATRECGTTTNKLTADACTRLKGVTTCSSASCVMSLVQRRPFYISCRLMQPGIGGRTGCSKRVVGSASSSILRMTMQKAITLFVFC